MNKTEQIQALDSHFTTLRPSQLDISSPDGQRVQGRFIYSENPGGLYEQVDPETERIPNINEVIRLRLWGVDSLLKEIVELKTAIEKLIKGEEVEQEIGQVRMRIAEALNDIWKVRLTTSTHMVRGNGEQGEDTVFFYSGSPFNSSEATSAAMEGQLSDGGIQYDNQALSIIRHDTPQASHLPFTDYLAARGGNFSGTDFLNHPIFSRAVGDRQLMEDYVWGLQIINLAGFYNPGLHSGWRPGEMKSGFGRPIALGYKGEAFYPPNNSTVDHCALAIPNDTEIRKIAES
ncbi:hypothetical protein KKB83_05805 [Patescibacteria group bacterium]|nr:hypothetical protein [Patescibacteria group bacterium]